MFFVKMIWPINACLILQASHIPTRIDFSLSTALFEKFTFGEISSLSLKIDKFLSEQEVQHPKTTILRNISKTIEIANKFRTAFGFEKIENVDLSPNKAMEMTDTLSGIHNKLKSDGFLSNSSLVDDFILSLNSDMLKSGNRKTVGLNPLKG